MFVSFVAASALAAGINAGQPIVAPGGHGGVAAYPVPLQRDNCVPTELADQIRREIALWALVDSPAPDAKQLAAAPLLPTTSLGANSAEDGINGNFVDLDPASPGF